MCTVRTAFQIKGFPVYVEENGIAQTSPVVTDVDRDNVNELIAGYSGNIYMWKPVGVRIGSNGEVIGMTVGIRVGIVLHRLPE